LPLEKIDEE
jgi:hypothetical protein